MAANPNLVGHPVAARADYSSKCIPIALHGDGVPVTGVGKAWSKSVEIYSWSSCLSGGNIVLSNFMVWLVHKVLVSKVPGKKPWMCFGDTCAGACNGSA